MEDEKLEGTDNAQNQFTDDLVPNVKTETGVPKFSLVVMDKANNLENKYSLEDGREIIAGADPECPVAVDDVYISFRHFSVKASGKTVEVKDLGSKNGLYLKIENALISPGQCILAGKTLFKLEQGDD